MGKEQVMTPIYVGPVKTDVAVALEIMRAKVMARVVDINFYPDSDIGGIVTDEGIKFIDINPARWDDGWEVTDQPVTWREIADAVEVYKELKRQERRIKGAEEKQVWESIV